LYYYCRLFQAKAIGFSEESPRFFRYLVAAALFGASALGIWLSFTRARADLVYRRNTIYSLSEAARLTPSNAAVHLSLALQQDLAGQNPEPELRAAARLDPLWSEPWMRLGLLAESRGDADAAERLLLHAAEIDRQFPPRAALMRFYARQSRAAEFWVWARRAIDRSYGDRSPLFDLCWTMARDPEEVYSKAVPPTRVALEAYVDYLLARGRSSVAATPATDLAAQAVAEDRELLLNYCDRRMDDAPSESVSIWNSLCRRGLLPYRPLDTGAPAVVNAEFSDNPFGRAFDWKLASTHDPSNARIPGGGLEFSFGGHQAEEIELISQKLWLISGKKYVVLTDFQTENVTFPGGFTVSVDDRSAPLPPADRLATVPLEFRAPASGVATLRVRYRRPLGSVRTEGTLILRRFRIEEPAP